MKIVLDGKYTCEVLRDGYFENVRCGEGGKHATSSVSVKIRPLLGDVNVANYLLTSQDSYVSAVLKEDDGTVRFTGVIRPYITHTSEAAYSGDLSLEVMDYTETLHEYIWETSTSGAVEGRIYSQVKKDTTLPSLITWLFGLKDKSLKNFTSSEEIVYFKLPEGEYLDEVIAEILYEYGLDYKWSTEGVAEVFATFIEDSPSKGDITSVITSLKTTRSDDTSDGLIISWKEYKKQPNVKIYDFDSGNMTFTDNFWTEGHTLATNLSGNLYSGQMHDSHFNPGSTMPDGNLSSWNYNWSGFKRKNGEAITSRDVLELTTDASRVSVQLLDEEDVSCTAHLDSYDTEGGRLYVAYNGRFNEVFGTGWTWKITVFGDLLLALDSEEDYNVTGPNPEEISLEYRMCVPGSKAISEEFAQKFGARQKYSKLQYSFNSLDSYLVGDFYKITDSVSGRTFTVRILSRVRDNEGIYQYTAEGASAIADADIKIIDRSSSYTKRPNQGQTEQELIDTVASWDVQWVPSVYAIEPRKTETGLITGKVLRNGATGTLACTVAESAFTVAIDGDTISISYNNEIATPTLCSVTVTIGSKSKYYYISGTLKDAEPKYFGPQDSDPSGEKYIDGDWYVKNSTNVLYVYTSTGWKAYNDISDFGNYPLEKVSVALADMIAIGTTSKTTATLLGVFKALCADEGLINNLSVLNLLIKNTSGLGVEIRSTDSSGNLLSTPIFKVTYNGTAVFQIDAATGNIFLGEPETDLSSPKTGLMYKASSQSLVTKDEKFKVDKDGNVYGFFKKVTQFVPFGFEDSLDSSHPFECDFVIPSGAEIVKITVSAKALAYRAYSSSAKYTGDFWLTTGQMADTYKQYVSIELTPTYYNYGISKTFDTGNAGKHSHEYTKATGLELEYWERGTTGDRSYSATLESHTHSYKLQSLKTETASTKETDNHSHTYTIPGGLLTGVSAEDISYSSFDHKHKLDINHNHELEYGIHEGSSPTSVNMYCDNGSGYGSAISLGSFSSVTDKDITSQFSGTGWKTLKFTSSSLGRLRVQLMLELRVSTTE